MSEPAVPPAPAAHAHGPGHGHAAGHDHGHDHAHGHSHAPVAAAPRLPHSLPHSLLMAGIGTRLLAVAGLLLLLWAAVAWALGEPA